MARVSVLLPVHNGGSYLPEAIRSVLVQTEEDLELVIIDDGSTDDSATIIRDFAQDDSRIHFYQQPAKGLVETLNRGLRLATSPLVARMDADDISHPDRLELQANYLDRHQRCLVIGSGITIISADGKALRQVGYPTGVALRQAMERGSAFAHPAVMFRRESVLSVGAYRSAFTHAEDYDLWLRLLEVGELDNLPQALLFYRQHGGQVSVRHAVGQATSTELARQLHKLRQSGQPEPNRDWNTVVKVEEIVNLALSPVAIAQILLTTLHRVVLQDDRDGSNSRKLFNLLSKMDRKVFAEVEAQTTLLRIAKAAMRQGHSLLGARAVLLALLSAPREFAAAFNYLAHQRRQALAEDAH